MISGRFEAIIDKKKRTTFPKKLVLELGENLILTKGLDRQLLVVPQNNWPTLLEGTQGKPFIQKDVRQLQRFLFGNAAELKLNSKGRFVIPTHLADYAQLKEEILFVGVERFVEIWSKKLYDGMEQEMMKNEEIVKIGERLTNTNE